MFHILNPLENNPRAAIASCSRPQRSITSSNYLNLFFLKKKNHAQKKKKNSHLVKPKKRKKEKKQNKSPVYMLRMHKKILQNKKGLAR